MSALFATYARVPLARIRQDPADLLPPCSLPAPRHIPPVDDDDEEQVEPIAQSTSSLSLTAPTPTNVIPPYGQRKGWRPKSLEDFGDGGSYPECPVAQYPLDLGKRSKVRLSIAGRKRSGELTLVCSLQTTAGNTLALQVDSDGNVRYDAIGTSSPALHPRTSLTPPLAAQQGHRDSRTVQSQFKDLVPMAHRTDIKDQSMERPSEEEVQNTADRTRAALEKLVSGKIKAAQPKHVPDTKGELGIWRGEEGADGVGGAQVRCRTCATRLSKAMGTSSGSSRWFVTRSPRPGPTLMPALSQIEVVEDPLEPPKFKGKKIPRGPPSPPPPILRSPPRKVTAQEQKDWMIPPCVSNWKVRNFSRFPRRERC